MLAELSIELITESEALRQSRAAIARGAASWLHERALGLRAIARDKSVSLKVRRQARVDLGAVLSDFRDALVDLALWENDPDAARRGIAEDLIRFRSDLSAQRKAARFGRDLWVALRVFARRRPAAASFGRTRSARRTRASVRRSRRQRARRARDPDPEPGPKPAAYPLVAAARRCVYGVHGREGQT